MVALLSWINHVDDAATVLTASHTAGDLAISNVADSIIGRRHRTTTLTAYGQADFGADKIVGTVALVFPRDTAIPVAGTVQHTFDANGGTPGTGAALDSGAVAIGTADGYGYHVYKPTNAVTARYWRWTFNVSGVSFIDTGRAWAGEAWQPAFDIAFGYGDEWADLSRVSSAQRSGAQYVDERARRRLFGFALNALSESERDEIREMQRIAGISKQVLFIKDPASPAKETVVGRLAQTTPILRPHISSTALYAKLFTVTESL